ncbi:DUF1177 domain-containing protein [Corynebacterium coyleae]|uniref:DUF1177 domain-containing protein n=1 Tax=Corynebacterium coyleae TaxID=53374 RepID=UPI00254E4188|nr:DUF1177 domain-containing protein [Corynebacterium coyleae]MDK6493123.1 DUF1177 domain-containing protein [Corynebacterium coyleae]
MVLKQAIQVLDELDNGTVSGESVGVLFRGFDFVDFQYETVRGEKGTTDFVRILIKGTKGKSSGGAVPTVGIIGRLGGIGARPTRIGYVSDGDGAASALTAALKLAEMSVKGDRLPGDVLVTTHICPDAPTQPHEPAEFMDSPVDISTMNRYEVDPEMDAILSIDTTRGNRICNHRGIAITPPVHEGYILKFSDDLLRILETVTGEHAKTLAITTQDITPYGNDVYHLNSIMQPVTAARVPVVGVAITAESLVAGSATGASHETDIALAARFVIETAKEVGQGKAKFIDDAEFAILRGLYGSMRGLYEVKPK